MVNKIAEVLELGPIQKIIRIEDVSTPEEMQIAHGMRMKHGKHVIPVPTFEVKKQFSGYFVDPMVQFFKRKNHTIAEEKTVMRPTYSYLGDYKISQRAIIDICTYEASRFASMYKLLRVKSSTTKGNRIVLDLELSLRYPCRIEAEANRIAENIKNSIEEHTSINVKYVNIYVKTLHVSRIYIRQIEKNRDDLLKAGLLIKIHTFECGQCFRWNPAENGYIGIAGRKGLQSLRRYCVLCPDGDDEVSGRATSRRIRITPK